MIVKKNYTIKDLLWDTNFFGVKSAKIYLNKEISDKDLEEIKKYIENNKYKFITIENHSNKDKNNKIISHLENAFLVDVNIQFQKEIKANVKLKNVENIYIKNSHEKNNDIINIASESFYYSRFISDTNLKNGNKVYSEWAINSFEKVDKYFCCYKYKNKIEGFLLFSIDKKNKSILLELIAIDSKIKNKGIGTKLINNLEVFAIENDIKIINVGTQLNNLQAQNFYEKNGFKHKENNSIYHWWKK